MPHPEVACLATRVVQLELFGDNPDNEPRRRPWAWLLRHGQLRLSALGRAARTGPKRQLRFACYCSGRMNVRRPPALLACCSFIAVAACGSSSAPAPATPAPAPSDVSPCDASLLLLLAWPGR